MAWQAMRQHLFEETQEVEEQPEEGAAPAEAEDLLEGEDALAPAGGRPDDNPPSMAVVSRPPRPAERERPLDQRNIKTFGQKCRDYALSWTTPQEAGALVANVVLRPDFYVMPKQCDEDNVYFSEHGAFVPEKSSSVRDGGVCILCQRGRCTCHPEPIKALASSLEFKPGAMGIHHRWFFKIMNQRLRLTGDRYVKKLIRRFRSRVDADYQCLVDELSYARLPDGNHTQDYSVVRHFFGDTRQNTPSRWFWWEKREHDDALKSSLRLLFKHRVLWAEVKAHVWALSQRYGANGCLDEAALETRVVRYIREKKDLDPLMVIRLTPVMVASMKELTLGQAALAPRSGGVRN